MSNPVEITSPEKGSQEENPRKNRCSDQNGPETAAGGRIRLCLTASSNSWVPAGKEDRTHEGDRWAEGVEVGVTEALSNGREKAKDLKEAEEDGEKEVIVVQLFRLNRVHREENDAKD